MLRWPRRYGFPVPFGMLHAFHGEPVDGREADSSECQAALEAVERDAAYLGGAARGR
jgi:hypothetical protein